MRFPQLLEIQNAAQQEELSIALSGLVLAQADAAYTMGDLPAAAHFAMIAQRAHPELYRRDLARHLTIGPFEHLRAINALLTQ